MKQNTIVKWAILGLLVFYSVFLVYNQGINYGIDIQGGHSFTLEIDRDKLVDNLERKMGSAPSESEIKEALEAANAQALQVIEQRINASGTREPVIYPEPSKNRIVVQLPGLTQEELEDVKSILLREAVLHFRMVHEDMDELARALFAEGKVPDGYEIVADPGGSPIQYYRQLDDAKTGSFDEDQITERLRRWERPTGAYEFYLESRNVGTIELYRPLFLDRRIELDGRSVDDATSTYDPNRAGGEWAVSMNLTKEAGEKFFKITKEFSPQTRGGDYPRAEGRRFAILLDDKVQSAPVIREPIGGGTASISGSFTADEAQELALVLRSGSLPAPLRIESERSVDPTLGRESLEKSVRALAIGAGCIIVFMLIYYRMAGTVVNLALLMDAILLPLGMMLAAGFLGLFADAGATASAGGSLPTLTLPGIAGIILTIGMAVDANVLIFERIREEQAEGKRFVSAVRAGYDKVFSTIFDANVTTLIVAVILFMQGSGPIRGFAVTLTAGIIVSMYTALVFTRMLFDAMANTNIKQLKMMHLVKATNIDFIGKRKYAAILSVALIAVSWGMFFPRGAQNFNVELTGGSSLTFTFNSEKAPSEGDLRKVLSDAGIEAPFVQFQKDLTDDVHLVNVQVPTDVGALAESSLAEAFGTANSLELKSSETIGSQIGGEMRQRGIMAIVFALIGIVAYITFRFEFGFAAGAIVALLHDVLITVGLYTLFGRQLSLPIIAALLTIVGYSVNDTIVVFDRIREDLDLLRGKKYKDIANLSINKTLSRTLLTSLTTLLTVVMLLLFGGESINDFALALFIGVLVGTYSSIFVATPVMLLWHRDDKVRG